MEDVRITLQGIHLNFDVLRQMTEILALQGNEFSTLVAWNDREKNVHSPQCLKCEIKGEQGWEVYGRNHEGRLRISINSDQFVFIYT